MNVYLLIDLNDPDDSMAPPIPLGVYSTEQKAQDAFVQYYNSALAGTFGQPLEWKDIKNECKIDTLAVDAPGANA